jgi:hypothetical protein
VKLQFAQTASSAHVRKGDRLNFVVVSEVAVGGFTLISAGTVAAGSVIGVRKKRPLGIGGKMIVKLDSVELTNGENVDLVGRREFKGTHTLFGWASRWPSQERFICPPHRSF